MRAPSRLLPLLALLVLLAGGGSAAATLFDEYGAVAHAVAAIRDKIGGGNLRVLKIEITPDEVVLQAQDPQDRRHVNEWRFSRWRVVAFGHSFTHESVSGPLPVPLDLINPDLESNLFDLDDIDFAAATKLAAAAIARAHLEDAGQVTGMEIARSVNILSATSGSVHWTVHVSSGRENASVIAGGDGTIMGADLSGTNYARTLDMTAAPDQLIAAMRAVRDVVGPGQKLIEVVVGRSDIRITTNIQDKTSPIGGGSFKTIYSWNASGLARALVGAPIIETPFVGAANDPFAVDDVDWTALPKVEETARQSLAMQYGKITEVKVAKPALGVRAPAIAWTVEIADGNDHGSVVIDAAGAVQQVMLPESRHRPSDWRDPQTLVDALARIDREFGPGAQFLSIAADKDKILITAQDPRKTDAVTSVILNDHGFERFGMPGGFMSGPTPWFTGNPHFTTADLKPLTAERLAALRSRTLARLQLPNIDRITIERANMDPSPRGNVVVEVRAEDHPFGHDGRIVYEMDGTVIQEYLPEGTSSSPSSSPPSSTPPSRTWVPVGADMIACNDSSDLDRLIAACTRIISNASATPGDRSIAYNNRGLAYGRKGDLDRELADCSEALMLNPTYPYPHVNRGIAYFFKGDPDRTIAEESIAITLDPNGKPPYAWDFRGRAFAAKGEFDSAIADYTHALQVDPTYEPAYAYRGRALYATEAFDRAIADYTEALRIDPKDTVVYDRAEAYMATRDFDRAIADYGARLALDPKNLASAFGRGRAFFYSLSMDKAQADFRQASELNPKYLYPAIWRVIAERRAGESSLDAPTGPPADAAAWQAALLRFVNGDLTQADLFSAAKDPDPKTQSEQVCEANFYSAEMALTQQRRDDAIRLFQLAGSSCPHHFVEYEGARAELARLGAPAAPTP